MYSIIQPLKSMFQISFNLRLEYQVRFAEIKEVNCDEWSALMIAIIENLPIDHEFINRFKKTDSQDEDIKLISDYLRVNMLVRESQHNLYGKVLRNYLITKYLINSYGQQIISEEILRHLSNEIQRNIGFHDADLGKSIKTRRQSFFQTIQIVKFQTKMYILLSQICCQCQQKCDKLYINNQCEDFLCISCINIHLSHSTSFTCPCQKSIRRLDFEEVIFCSKCKKAEEKDQINQNSLCNSCNSSKNTKEFKQVQTKLCLCCGSSSNLNQSNCGHFYCESCIKLQFKQMTFCKSADCTSKLDLGSFRRDQFDSLQKSCEVCSRQQNLREAKCKHIYCEFCLKDRLTYQDSFVCKNSICTSRIEKSDFSIFSSKCSKCLDPHPKDKMFKNNKCPHTFCKNCYFEQSMAQNKKINQCFVCTNEMLEKEMNEYFSAQMIEPCKQCSEKNTKQIQINCGHNFCQKCIELFGKDSQTKFIACFTCSVKFDIQEALNFFRKNYPPLLSDDQAQCDSCSKILKKNLIFTNDKKQCAHNYCEKCIQGMITENHFIDCSVQKCQGFFRKEVVMEFLEKVELENLLAESQIELTRVQCLYCKTFAQLPRRAEYMKCGDCKQTTCLKDKCLIEFCLCKCLNCLSDLQKQGDDHSFCFKCNQMYCLRCKERVYQTFYHDCRSQQYNRQNQYSLSPNKQQEEKKNQMDSDNKDKQEKYYNQAFLIRKDFQIHNTCSLCFQNFDEFVQRKNQKTCGHQVCIFCKLEYSFCPICQPEHILNQEDQRNLSIRETLSHNLLEEYRSQEEVEKSAEMNGGIWDQNQQQNSNDRIYGYNHQDFQNEQINSSPPRTSSRLNNYGSQSKF